MVLGMLEIIIGTFKILVNRLGCRLGILVRAGPTLETTR